MGFFPIHGTIRHHFYNAVCVKKSIVKEIIMKRFDIIRADFTAKTSAELTACALFAQCNMCDVWHVVDSYDTADTALKAFSKRYDTAHISLDSDYDGDTVYCVSLWAVLPVTGEDDEQDIILYSNNIVID